MHGRACPAGQADARSRILAGLEQKTAGQVLLEGKPVHGPGRDRGMVFQGYTLFPWLTVRKNVMFGLERGGMDGETASREALQWLATGGAGTLHRLLSQPVVSAG